MQNIGKILITIGIIVFIIGVLMVFVKKLPFNLGNLPGDINIKKENFSFYFPITTSIIISIIFSIILTIVSRLFKWGIGAVKKFANNAVENANRTKGS